MKPIVYDSLHEEPYSNKTYMSLTTAGIKTLHIAYMKTVPFSICIITSKNNVRPEHGTCKCLCEPAPDLQ